MFPVFPVLFPVCSQFRANAFNVFLVFSVSAADSISAVSYIPFLQAGNDGTWIAIELLACLSWTSSPTTTTGNDWEQISAEQR